MGFTKIDNDLTKFGIIHSQELAAALKSGVELLYSLIPVGQIFPIAVGIPGVPDPDPNMWQRCDGSEITNPASPLRSSGGVRRYTPYIEDQRFIKPAVNTGLSGQRGGSTVIHLGHDHSLSEDGANNILSSDGKDNAWHSTGHTHDVNPYYGWDTEFSGGLLMTTTHSLVVNLGSASKILLDDGGFYDGQETIVEGFPGAQIDFGTGQVWVNGGLNNTFTTVQPGGNTTRWYSVAMGSDAPGSRAPRILVTPATDDNIDPPWPSATIKKIGYVGVSYYSWSDNYGGSGEGYDPIEQDKIRWAHPGYGTICEPRYRTMRFYMKIQ